MKELIRTIWCTVKTAIAERRIATGKKSLDRVYGVADFSDSMKEIADL